MTDGDSVKIVVDNSDRVVVTVVWLHGQWSAYVHKGMVEHAVGAHIYWIADLFAGLCAFEAGVIWPYSCASS